MVQYLKDLLVIKNFVVVVIECSQQPKGVLSNLLREVAIWVRFYWWLWTLGTSNFQECCTRKVESRHLWTGLYTLSILFLTATEDYHARSYIIGVTSVDIETLNCRARSISVGSSFIVMCCLYLFIFGVAFRNTERYWFICTRCNRGIIASTVQWWFGLRQTASSLTFHPVSLQIFLFLSETFRPLPFVPLTIQQLFFSSLPFNTVTFSLLSLDTFTIYSLPFMAFMLLAFSHLPHLL